MATVLPRFNTDNEEIKLLLVVKSSRTCWRADSAAISAIFNNFRFEDVFFEGECNQRLPKANTVLKAVKSSEDNWPNLRPLGRAHERDERTKIPSTGRSEIPDD